MVGWVVPLLVTIFVWSWHFRLHQNNRFRLTLEYVVEIAAFVVTAAISLIVTLIAWIAYLLVT